MPNARRSPNHDTAALAATRDIAGPFQDRIAQWQKQVAHLKGHRLVRAEPDITQTASDLFSLVIASQIEFEFALEEIDSEVRSHAILIGVASSLQRLRDELDQLQRGPVSSPESARRS